MYVIKKDNTKELFNIQKVVTAINKSATRCLYKFKEGEEAQICDFVEARVKDFNSNEITISQMHNVVEGALDAINPKVAKNIFILFIIKTILSLIYISLIYTYSTTIKYIPSNLKIRH